MAIGKDDLTRKYNKIIPHSVFNYHKIELLNKPTCRYFNKLTLKNETSIKFGLEAFISPYHYLTYEEQESDIKKYEEYFTAKNTDNIYFKDNVKDEVSICGRLDKLWSGTETDYKKSTAWRYYGSETDFIRVSPGTRLAKKYSPKLRPWYKRAIGNKDGTVISPAYIDAFGAGYVITLSHVVYEGRSSGHHKSTDYILGVMGIDIKMSNFYFQMKNTMKECLSSKTTCLMIDKSGLVIVHKNWVEKFNSLPEIENQHLSKVEPKVASSLLTAGIMKKEHCFNLGRIKDQSFYTVSLNFH